MTKTDTIVPNKPKMTFKKDTPKIVSSALKIKTSPVSNQLKRNLNSMGALKSTIKANYSKVLKYDVRLCSERCPASYGELPSLQCSVCLCLFHPECTGQVNKSPSQFTCARCSNDLKADAQNMSNLKADESLIDDDSSSNISVLSPEVVLQHEGSDQEEITITRLTSTLSPSTVYCLPCVKPPVSGCSIADTPRTLYAANNNCSSSHPTYQNSVLNMNNTFIRPIPTLRPAFQRPQQISMNEKKVTSSSIYYPPLANNSHLRLIAVPSGVRFPNPNQPFHTNTPPLIRIPTAVRSGSPVTVTSGNPSITTRYFSPSTTIATNVTQQRPLFLSSSNPCLVLAPRSNVLCSNSTSKVLGPFPASCLPQLMAVGNKFIYIGQSSSSSLPSSSSLSSSSLSSSSNQSVVTGSTQSSNVSVSSTVNILPQFTVSPVTVSTVSTLSKPKTNSETVSSHLMSLLNSPSLTNNKVANIKKENIVPSQCESVSLEINSVNASGSSIPVTSTSSNLNNNILISATNENTSLKSIVPFTISYKSESDPSMSVLYPTCKSSTICKISDPLIVQSSIDLTQSVISHNSPTTLTRMQTTTTPAITSPMTTSRVITDNESSDQLSQLNKQFIKTHSDRKFTINSKKRKISLDESSTTDIIIVRSENSSEFNNHCNKEYEDDEMRTVKKICNSYVPGLKEMMDYYEILNNIFSRLKVPDLLRARLVCKTWNKLASQPFLWEKVHLENVIITDWKQFAITIEKQRTNYLNLNGIESEGGLDYLYPIWRSFVTQLTRLEKLSHLEFGKVPTFVLYAVAENLIHLKSLKAVCVQTGNISSCILNMSFIEKLVKLEYLQLRSFNGLIINNSSDSSPFHQLTQLRHLSITTVKDIDSEHLKFLDDLIHLESLEIGDCCNWNVQNFSSLGKLTNLRKLRIEKESSNKELVDALSNLIWLEELHLICCKIHGMLGTALKKLKNLKLLSFWPDTSNCASTVNSNTLNAVNSLTSLKELRWIILHPITSSTSDITSSAKRKLEECKECQINCEDDTPLLPFEENCDSLKTNEESESMSKLHSTQYITINELMEKLQQMLPLTKIKIYQLPLSLVDKYCAFR